jgi:hypothetical protein
LAVGLRYVHGTALTSPPLVVVPLLGLGGERKRAQPKTLHSCGCLMRLPLWRFLSLATPSGGGGLSQRSVVLKTESRAPSSKKSLRAIATEPKNNAKTTDTNKNLIEPNWLMRPSQRFPFGFNNNFWAQRFPR